MNTNLTNQIELRKLTFGDLVQNLGHGSFGNYYLPTPSDLCTTVNGEVAFEAWKSKTLLKYPKATVTLNPNAPWYAKIKMNDQAFNYDQQIYIATKARILQSEGY